MKNQLLLLWMLLISFNLSAQNKLTEYEYWFDNDYSVKIKVPITPATTYQWQATIPCEQLSAGLHTFNTRFKDSAGKWSATISQHFQKFPEMRDNKMAAYEYWINDDYDKKVTVKVSSQQTVTLLDSINCSSANKVINTISYRFQDATGLWSSTVTSNFYYPVTISVNLTYTKSVLQGETPVTEDWYPNYSDVGFNLFNITKGQDITDIAFQYPNIALNQPIDVGDSISITAISHSATNSFEPVTKKIVIGNDSKIPVTFNIIQHGLVRSTYQNSENSANVGIVYDAEGRRIAQYDYSNKTLTTGELTDGSYQLLSMANSPFFNTIQHLSAFASTELKHNMDYVLQSVEVKSGKITETTVTTIPKLDENKVYYTTNSTLFSVNKTLIAIGNYVTLRSEVEFKEEHRTKVSNVKLIVDIPESCSFVNNSVMIGNNVFNDYVLQNNQLIIPLANYSDIVKFCIIPTEGGIYAPNGFIEFNLDGKTILQPIGTANFTAEGLTIIVPSVTAQNTIPVRGTVTAKSIVKVYDKDEFIGQTTALSNGNWTIQCELYKPYAFSIHNIHAEILSPQGLTMQTETKEVIYDNTATEVSKVTMYNTAHPSTSLDLCEYVTEFNFLNPAKEGGVYWYWPNYPDFTFKIEFTNNDPDLVSDVKLNVLTSSGSIVTLPTVYNDVKQAWVAAGKFPDSHNLPVNVSVKYQREYIEVETDSIMLVNILNDAIKDVEIKDIQIKSYSNNHNEYIVSIGNDNLYTDIYKVPKNNKEALIQNIENYDFSKMNEASIIYNRIF